MRPTAQERGVAELIGEGLSDERVAQQLSLPVRTVKEYVESIMIKLGLTRRREICDWFNGS